MAIGVNTNVMSLNAQRSLTNTQQGLATAMQRLSSGLRINSAKDDAAGLQIAEAQNAQVRGLTVAIRNANDGISLAQSSEGALGGMTESLQRMRELAVQAANGVGNAALDLEFQALKTEIDATAVRAGLTAGTTTFQIGANAGETVDIIGTDMTGIGAAIGDVTDFTNASTAIGAIDTALGLVNTERATFGAAQSRMESIIRAQDIVRENTAAARGRIMDADFGAETANLTRMQILQQAGVAILSQANSQPQVVLGLLQ